MAEDDLWACRTGLPGPLADGYSPTSESEEEDEADEDSNGASHAL
jgi:hypothetical protein